MAPLTSDSSDWREWRGLLAVLFALILLRAMAVDWSHVPSRSMAPGIVPGDRILVNKLAYGLRLPFTDAPMMQWHTPQRSDAVVFLAPLSGLLTVKRVIGVPGDRVSWRDGILRVNGINAIYHRTTANSAVMSLASAQAPVQVYSESLLQQDHTILRRTNRSRLGAKDFIEVAVPEHHYLMLGDNRDNSSDYRAFGFVPKEALVGRVSYILFSLNPQNYYLPRWQRWGSALD